MKPHDPILDTSLLAEMAEMERTAQQTRRKPLAEMLGHLCADLSLYAFASESEDAQLLAVSRGRLQHHAAELARSKMMHLAFKSNPAFTYRHLTKAIQNIVENG